LDDYQRVALTSADWSSVHARFTVDVISEHLADERELLDRVRDSEVIVLMRERTPFPARVLDQLPALRLLVTTGMANASIDLPAARAHGVTVSGTRGSSTAVPELTIGMMIALMRNFAPEDAALRSGGWQHTVGPGLAGTTLGVVGLGRLGTPVARLAQAFDMAVVAWSPNLTPERAAEHGVRGQQRRAVRRVGRRHDPHAAVRSVPRLSRRRRPRADAAVVLSGEHLAWADRR
jgi:phosphoglycerate dehydrogenase-like enzyme